MEIVLTIDENGDQTFLKTEGTQVFLANGEVRTQRASHVEPDDLCMRLAFTVIRALVWDSSAVAKWTRTWSCVWRVNTSPVGGPILEGRWKDRREAIFAEIEFLNRFFAR